MYHFIDYNNAKEDKEDLETAQKNINIDYDKLDKLIKEWVKNIRAKGKVEYKKTILIPHIGRDVLFWSIRRLLYSIKTFNSIQENDMHSWDIKFSMLLIFFVNAKFLFEIIKEHVKKIKLTKSDLELYRTIRIIRNYLAHADKKDFIDWSSIIAEFDMNFQYNTLELLDLYDTNTWLQVWSLCFSLNKIYDDLVKLIERYLKAL